MKSRKVIVAICLALVLTLSLSAVAFAVDLDIHTRYSDNTLKRSSTVKACVKNVQADLSANTTYTLTPDGIYGSNTYKAAVEFQEKKELDVDGQVGKNTKAKLYPLRDKSAQYV